MHTQTFLQKIKTLKIHKQNTIQITRTLCNSKKYRQSFPQHKNVATVDRKTKKIKCSQNLNKET